jgi:hypothetical protein
MFLNIPTGFPWVGRGGGCCRVSALMAPNVEPLESLNNNARFDLRESLTLSLGNNSESNPYIDNPISTTYSDTDTIPDLMSGADKCILLALISVVY